MSVYNQSPPYIEIFYSYSEEHKDNPWLVTHGNLPKEFNGKKYRVYLEELDDNNKGEK